MDDDTSSSSTLTRVLQTREIGVHVYFADKYHEQTIRGGID